MKTGDRKRLIFVIGIILLVIIGVIFSTRKLGEVSVQFKTQSEAIRDIAIESNSLKAYTKMQYDSIMILQHTIKRNDSLNRIEVVGRAAIIEKLNNDIVTYKKTVDSLRRIANTKYDVLQPKSDNQ